MNKISLPAWAGDDLEVDEGMDEDLETMIIITIKKVNEIVEWINEQS